MEDIPAYISIVFALTTGITILLYYRAANNSVLTLSIIVGWLIIQAVLSKSGFYTITNTWPPRFLLAILPPVLLIAVLFFAPAGKRYVDSLDPKILTLLHTVRVPVELVIYWLFLHKAVPKLMTFEGRNFDLFSGLTAPIIFYFGFIKIRLPKTLLILWNLLCLLLLINIVVNAILSAPFPFQKFGFDQPNVAILHFPFIWLPCCIVPLVLFSHLVTIRQLLHKRNEKRTSNSLIY